VVPSWAAASATGSFWVMRRRLTASGSMSSGSGQGGAGLRILLAEDHPVNQRVAAHMLGRAKPLRRRDLAQRFGVIQLPDSLQVLANPFVLGLAIILFTIFLRMVLMPLSLVQIRSQRAQMGIQPEVKAIQKKFKGDREGLARAQMALYKERGINPAAGCVPLLIQMPILFGMYAAINQLATRA